MGTNRLLCPGCSGDLMANQVSGLRQYVCAGCGGTVMTVAVLRQLEGSLAEHLWTEAPAVEAGGGDARCPFCTRLMQPKTIPAGRAAMCKGCEVVWLDKQAVQSLPDKARRCRPRADARFPSAQVPSVRGASGQQLGRKVPVLRLCSPRPHPGRRPARARSRRDGAGVGPRARAAPPRSSLRPSLLGPRATGSSVGAPSIDGGRRDVALGEHR